MRQALPRGFSLIEILIVLAVISILSMVAVPHYLEYAVRVKVESELGTINFVKKQMTEEFLVTNEWPTSNAMALLESKESYSGKYLQSIEVGDVPVDGAITVTFDKSKIPALNNNNTIVYYPTGNGAHEKWVCDKGSMLNPYRPPACRK